MGTGIRGNGIDLARESDFAIGSMAVRPSACEIDVAPDMAERIEPRVMQVLIMLVRARGAVVSRDELIEHCWGGLIVSDDAVNRVMSRIRRLSRLVPGAFSLETIPKIGYRLTPGSAVDAEPTATDTQAPPDAAEADTLTRLISRARVLRRHPFSWARAAVAALMIAAAAAIVRWQINNETGTSPRTLAVLPFAAVGKDAAAEAFALRFSAELHSAMGRSGPGVRLIGWASSGHFYGDRKQLQVIRREVAATHVLDGKAARSGDRISVEVELVGTATGLQDWRREFSADLRDEEQLLTHIVGHVREALMVSSARPAPSRSYDRRALELYYSVAEDTPSRDAIEVLRQAVQIEPGFARAWLRLADHYMVYGKEAPTLAERQAANDRGRLAALRYRELAPEDATAWLMVAGFTYDRDEAVRLFERAMQLDDRNSLVVNWRLYMLGHTGGGRAGLALSEQALVLDPLHRHLTFNRARHALISERFDVVEATLRGMESVVAASLLPAVVMARLERGEYPQARAALRDLEASIVAIERAPTPRPTYGSFVGRVRRRVEELREILVALESEDLKAREALVRRFAARAGRPLEDPAGLWYGFPWYVYAVELPAISLLGTTGQAFEAWDRRLKALSPYDPDDPTGDHSMDVEALWYRFLPGFRRLQHDPRFWEYAARYDPRAFDHLAYFAPPPPDEVVAPWGDVIWPPDFCRAPGFPYDCDKVARAAFAAVDVRGRPQP